MQLSMELSIFATRAKHMQSAFAIPVRGRKENKLKQQVLCSHYRPFHHSGDKKDY